MSGGRREKQSAPSGQQSQSRQTDGRRAAAAEGKAESTDGLERPPPVGDGGDRQTTALLRRANRGAG